MIVRRKVFAYITSGARILLLLHPYAPQAGIQVPAGSIESGDRSLTHAVLREAYEETGLEDLHVVAYLGSQVYAVNAQLHQRHFFHLRTTAETPDCWLHVERFASDGHQHLFELCWAALPYRGPELIAGHGALLARLPV